MGAFIDLTGKKFERLTVIKKEYKKGAEWYWLCQCDCGNTCTVIGSSLRAGRTRSCGCLKQESDKKPKGNVIDETGNKYGHLTVVKRAGSTPRGIALWECVCDCGSSNSIIVTGDNLRRGHTISCGCERASHGEYKITQLLEENKIPYQKEYKAFQFESGGYASFDFFINNSYMVEYDGLTHYSYNLHGWHTKQQFLDQQKRDQIKNQWCKDNNVPLIRIPYTHLNDLCIEDLLLETTTFLINQ